MSQYWSNPSIVQLSVLSCYYVHSRVLLPAGVRPSPGCCTWPPGGRWGAGELRPGYHTCITCNSCYINHQITNKVNFLVTRAMVVHGRTLARIQFIQFKSILFVPIAIVQLFIQPFSVDLLKMHSTELTQILCNRFWGWWHIIFLFANPTPHPKSSKLLYILFRTCPVLCHGKTDYQTNDIHQHLLLPSTVYWMVYYKVQYIPYL